MCWNHTCDMTSHVIFFWFTILISHGILKMGFFSCGNRGSIRLKFRLKKRIYWEECRWLVAASGHILGPQAMLPLGCAPDTACARLGIRTQPFLLNAAFFSQEPFSGAPMGLAEMVSALHCALRGSAYPNHLPFLSPFTDGKPTSACSWHLFFWSFRGVLQHIFFFLISFFNSHTMGLLLRGIK